MRLGEQAREPQQSVDIGRRNAGALAEFVHRRHQRIQLDRPATLGVDQHRGLEGADPARLAKWAETAGWEKLLNRAGTTFRKLDEADKADIDQAKALRLMAANPSIIKRPVVEYRGGVLVGFKPEEWAAALL